MYPCGFPRMQVARQLLATLRLPKEAEATMKGHQPKLRVVGLD